MTATHLLANTTLKGCVLRGSVLTVFLSNIHWNIGTDISRWEPAAFKNCADCAHFFTSSCLVIIWLFIPRPSNLRVSYLFYGCKTESKTFSSSCIMPGSDMLSCLDPTTWDLNVIILLFYSLYWENNLPLARQDRQSGSKGILTVSFKYITRWYGMGKQKSRADTG